MIRFARRFASLPLVLFGLLSFGSAAEPVRPVAIMRLAPDYPKEMRRERIGGTVVVEFVVAKDGTVQQARVVRSSRREFEIPAVRAIQGWRFQPGTLDGKPINTRASQSLEFSSPRAWVQPYDLVLKGKVDLVVLAYWQDAKGRLQRVEVVNEGTGSAVQAAQAILADEVVYNPESTIPVGLEQRTTYNFGVDQLSNSAREILKMLAKTDPGFARPADLDHPVVLRAQDAALFPMSLRETETKGEATIEFFIDRQGLAQLPRAVSASREEFGCAAAQAVGQWRFDPPLRNGKPVVVRVRVPIEFQLSTKS